MSHVGEVNNNPGPSFMNQKCSSLSLFCSYCKLNQSWSFFLRNDCSGWSNSRQQDNLKNGPSGKWPLCRRSDGPFAVTQSQPFPSTDRLGQRTEKRAGKMRHQYSVYDRSLALQSYVLYFRSIIIFPNKHTNKTTIVDKTSSLMSRNASYPDFGYFI